MSAILAIKILWIHKLRDGNCLMVRVGDRGERCEVEMPSGLLSSFVKVRGWLFERKHMVLSPRLRRGWGRYIADCMIYCDLDEPCEVCDRGLAEDQKVADPPGDGPAREPGAPPAQYE